MKKIFFAATLLAASIIGVCTASADDLSYRMESDTVKPAPIASVPNFSDTTPAAVTATDSQTAAPVMIFIQPTPVAVSRTTFVSWPVVTFGFGFGHPYVSGYYRGNYGRVNYHTHP